MLKAGKLFIISAPSGGGKTSLTHAVIDRLCPEIELKKVITYTSRPQRTIEHDAVDYHFISRDDFLHKIQSGFFLETTDYNGNYYGSPASIKDDLKRGKSFILVTDRPGAQKILELIKDAVLIWLIPPSLHVLEERIQKRATEFKQEITQRMAIARQELNDEAKEPIFKYTVLNDNFDHATDELCMLIRKELNKFS